MLACFSKSALNNLKTNVINFEYLGKSKRTFVTKLVFNEYGNPVDVVKKVTEKDLPEPSRNEVLLEILASPINPADINIIQGKYPVKKSFPAIGGSEGVGRIVKLGEDVKMFKEGDHVISIQPTLGTWTTHTVFPQNFLKRVSKDLSPAEASILLTNPCTSYRMLKCFVNLKKGDTVIQNAANSSCGQLALQLCKLWGITSINVVRDRPNIDELKQYLKNLGATYVLTEEELRRTQLFKSGEVPKPKLALNCVGGRSSTELLKHLDHDGVLVTYGGMSMEPITVSVSALIFKNIKLFGYNNRFWQENSDPQEMNALLDELVSLFLNTDLKMPAYNSVSLDNFQEALNEGLTNKTGKKYIFEMNKP